MPEAIRDDTCDVLVIGGGVNGCGIARDAAGRGLSVILCEKGDLGGATSSASTKLFHGGLRYLEYFEFKLVREALKEREVLLRAMPHISWPMRFVLPINPALRYLDDASSLGQILSRFAPFLKGRRPAWLTRIGLFVYDNLGGRSYLPATSTLDLKSHAAGSPLKRDFIKAFEYSDGWVDDARLVVLNARDAADKGAQILTRTECTGATRSQTGWDAVLTDARSGEERRIHARAIVNAAGPWVADVLTGKLRQNSRESVRLVRGSHIVVRRLFDHDQPYFLQQPDGRIIFAIPYESDFTLIGTTDQEHEDPALPPVCTDEERDYLLAAASYYFAKPVTADDIVWTYSGVRPLYDDDATSATAATRDYVLSFSHDNGASPLLSVFGGKITTFRRLAEEAVTKVAGSLSPIRGPWTSDAPLPGGNFAIDGAEALIVDLQTAYPFLTEPWARRLIRAYGTDAEVILSDAKAATDLGRNFGANLTEAEVKWLMTFEWAACAEDVIWRRSKLGLRLTSAEVQSLDDWMSKAHA